ncbi:MAG: hypothetical protein M0002_14230 [Rhodospirillales bacterium]|nr:hypothetical protein [Rhodospirillales bacterium]
MTTISIAPLEGRDLAEYGVVRVRDQAFDAVLALWRKRSAAGLTQKALADAIGRDRAWVSKNLRAPGNWTLRTFGELVQGLNGEVEIKLAGSEDAVVQPANYYAYDGYITGPSPSMDINSAGTISLGSSVVANIEISGKGRLLGGVFS